MREGLAQEAQDEYAGREREHQQARAAERHAEQRAHADDAGEAAREARRRRAARRARVVVRDHGVGRRGHL